MANAHKDAFVRQGNASSNEALTVTYQLNYGIRIPSTESHYINNSIYLRRPCCWHFDGDGFYGIHVNLSVIQ